MRDTFLTRGYKSGWIHTCRDRSLCKEVVKVQFADYATRAVRSVHAAKIAITLSEQSFRNPLPSRSAS